MASVWKGDNMSPLPLEGIRILELTVIYAGPYASLIRRGHALRLVIEVPKPTASEEPKVSTSINPAW